MSVIDKKANITKDICPLTRQITRDISQGAYVDHTGTELMEKVFSALTFDHWCPAQQRAYLNKFRHV